MMELAELLESDRHCRFPLDDVHWCGAETVGKGSWCAKHRCRVFLPPERIPRRLLLDDERKPTAAEEVRATWLRAGTSEMEIQEHRDGARAHRPTKHKRSKWI